MSSRPGTLNRYANGVLLTLTVVVLFKCGNDNEIHAIYPGLSEEIRYVKLSQSLYTSSSTLLANGTNSVKFYLEFFDANQKQVTTFATPSTVKLKINDSDELGYPWRFQTATPGTYTFTLQDFAEESILRKEITIQAIADKQYEKIEMPVVFHYIVAPGQLLEMSQITTLLKINEDQLNRAFSNRDDSQDANAVDMKLSFRLATTDPTGAALTTPGLHIVENENNEFDDKDDPQLEDIIWNGNYWSPKQYVNVWICNFKDKYSYGNFPPLSGGTSDFPTINYGVFFHVKHFKASSTKSVLVHEMGHVLNLYHVFDPSCAKDPDYCSDTEQYERGYEEDEVGGLQRISCTDVRFISDNYMDYWPNEYNTFTFEQRERVRRTLEQCPFLPSPKNSGSTGGRSAIAVSHPKMPHHSSPEQGTF